MVEILNKLNMLNKKSNIVSGTYSIVNASKVMTIKRDIADCYFEDCRSNVTFALKKGTVATQIFGDFINFVAVEKEGIEKIYVLEDGTPFWCFIDKETISILLDNLNKEDVPQDVENSWLELNAIGTVLLNYLNYSPNLHTIRDKGKSNQLINLLFKTSLQLK